jgi:hypothetical protein
MYPCRVGAGPISCLPSEEPIDFGMAPSKVLIIIVARIFTMSKVIDQAQSQLPDDDLQRVSITEQQAV